MFWCVFLFTYHLHFPVYVFTCLFLLGWKSPRPLLSLEREKLSLSCLLGNLSFHSDPRCRLCSLLVFRQGSLDLPLTHFLPPTALPFFSLPLLSSVLLPFHHLRLSVCCLLSTLKPLWPCIAHSVSFSSIAVLRSLFFPQGCFYSTARPPLLWRGQLGPFCKAVLPTIRCCPSLVSHVSTLSSFTTFISTRDSWVSLLVYCPAPLLQVNFTKTGTSMFPAFRTVPGVQRYSTNGCLMGPSPLLTAGVEVRNSLMCTHAV